MPILKGYVNHPVLIFVVITTALHAETITTTFDDPGLLKKWELKGDAELDVRRNHAGKGKDAVLEDEDDVVLADGNGSLRLGPGSSAIWKLRDDDGSGKLELWAYDDLTAHANPTAYNVGPRWGLIQADGRVLVMGVMYARYLSGHRTYTASDFGPEDKTWFQLLQYSALKREFGWHKWRFEFDPEKGITIHIDGKKARFDWNRGKAAGFCGVVLYGDAAKEERQTFWVDDISVELGGPMKVKPKPPPPPPPVVPEQDPEVKEPASLLPEIAGKHPRLLFTAEELEGIRERAKGVCQRFVKGVEAYLPSCNPPEHSNYLSDATDAQRQGLWRAPTAAMHYLLTKDNSSFTKAKGFLEKFLADEHWETGRERDSGMGAGNIMVGAALVYDWLYNDLEDGLREKARRKLILQARRMYHGGHLKKLKGIHYWQQDPQNNHRMHRLAGLVLCALAGASGAPGDQWILKKTYEELKFMHDWLAPDGSFHESSSYMAFGCQYLVLAFDASDRCFGTKFLEHDFIKNNPLFRMHTLTPGFKSAFPYGDAGGLGFYNNYLLKCTAKHQLSDLQSAIWKTYEAAPKSFHYDWFSLIWYDPTVEPGSLDKLPKTRLYPDLGLGLVREGWSDRDAAMLFKCGPYGGHTLNKYRNERNFHYINVAHNHPDANSFQIFAGGHLLATDDHYPNLKLTRAHNTILVNGKGQRGEGQGWTQPLRGTDMTKLANLVTWKYEGQVVIMEGEAGGLYDSLDRFRRLIVWVERDYLLVADDIAAKDESELTWVLHGPDIKEVDRKEHLYALKKEGATCGFRILTDKDAFEPPEMEILVFDDASDHKGKKKLRGKQMQVSVRADEWSPVVLFDPWSRKGLSGELLFEDGPPFKIVVSGDGFKDTWIWDKSEDALAPAALKGTREGGFETEIGEEDRAPIPYRD